MEAKNGYAIFQGNSIYFTSIRLYGTGNLFMHEASKDFPCFKVWKTKKGAENALLNLWAKSESDIWEGAEVKKITFDECGLITW